MVARKREQMNKALSIAMVVIAFEWVCGKNSTLKVFIQGEDSACKVHLSMRWHARWLVSIASTYMLTFEAPHTTWSWRVGAKYRRRWNGYICTMKLCGDVLWIYEKTGLFRFYFFVAENEGQISGENGLMCMEGDSHESEQGWWRFGYTPTLVHIRSIYNSYCIVAATLGKKRHALHIKQKYISFFIRDLKNVRLFFSKTTANFHELLC